MRDAQDIKAIVIRLSAEQAGVPADQVSPEHSYVNDLGFDSLDQVELGMELEDEFEISAADEELDQLKNVGDAIAFIERKVNDTPSEEKPQSSAV